MEDGAADGLGGFVQRIGDDLRILARDEVELAREEVQRVARGAAAEAAMLVIASVIGVIAIAMLSVSAVVAADAIIESLAIRLLLMTAVYVVVAGLLALYASRRLSRTLRNPLTLPVKQAKRAAIAVKQSLTTDERPSHA